MCQLNGLFNLVFSRTQPQFKPGRHGPINSAPKYLFIHIYDDNETPHLGDGLQMTARM